MQFGAQLVNYFTTWEDIVSRIETVKSGHWHSLWFSDHFLTPSLGGNFDHGAALEGWTLITAAATLTKR